ncbi:unnamed protein product [Rhizophagus irregularis]|nr:unnamed protein product [Rhizophagus irregularis]
MRQQQVDPSFSSVCTQRPHSDRHQYHHHVSGSENFFFSRFRFSRSRGNVIHFGLRRLGIRVSYRRLKNATASGFIRHASLFSFLVQDFGDQGLQTRELTWYGEMGFGLLLIRKGFEKSFRKSRTIPNSIIVVFLDFGAMGI